MARIGVIICHCGSNIATTIDVKKVAETASGFHDVVFAKTCQYTCSQPGQAVIRQAITDYRLDRLVIGACTPRMHEHTFRKLLSDTVINPYMLEIVNLREQCAWVHDDCDKATHKARDLIRAAIAKVRFNKPLTPSKLPITKQCLVIGGGIAGIQAALDIADAGYGVTLVEKEPSIGGNMTRLDKTFPTMDCSACICTPKMADVDNHPNITLMTSSEVESVNGGIGNFEVVIKTKARYVNDSLCTGCGICEAKCPTKVENAFELGLATRKSVYKPFAQAVPFKPVIDPVYCLKLTKGQCGICEQVCPMNAIMFDDRDRLTTRRFGAVIVATGYQLIDWGRCYPEYGSGQYADVITGMQFERMVNASGPTAGEIRRRSDEQVPKTVVIVKCVGSRDPAKGKKYCSRVCCMAAAKHAHQVLEKIPDARCYVFYIDVRTPGKGYEEFYRRALGDGAVYIRGRVAKIYQENKKLICLGEDSLLGSPVSVEADLVILETAMTPAAGAARTAELLNVDQDSDGWFDEAHPKLRPVETHHGGIYLCGACQGPKDIPDTVTQASAAAMKVCAMFSKASLESHPMIASVAAKRCDGCKTCEGVCPYKAISVINRENGKSGRPEKGWLASINPGLCQGCGTCAAACRSGCIELAGFTDRQILEEVDALCRD